MPKNAGLDFFTAIREHHHSLHARFRPMKIWNDLGRMKFIGSEMAVVYHLELYFSHMPKIPHHTSWYIHLFRCQKDHVCNDK